MIVLLGRGHQRLPTGGLTRHDPGGDMGDRHVSMIINAPPRLYTDPGRAREWLSGVREVRATGPPDQPGSRAVMVYGGP